MGFLPWDEDHLRRQRAERLHRARCSGGHAICSADLYPQDQSEDQSQRPSAADRPSPAAFCCAARAFCRVSFRVL